MKHPVPFYLFVFALVLLDVWMNDQVEGAGAIGMSMDRVSGKEEQAVLPVPQWRGSSDPAMLGSEDLGLLQDVAPAVRVLPRARLSVTETPPGEYAAGDGEPAIRSREGNLKGGMDLGDDRVGATISSAYATTQDPLQPGLRSASTSHAVRGSFRLLEGLRVEPSLSLSRYEEQWSGVRTTSPSASLGLSYAPISELSYRMGGGYGETIGIGTLSRLNTFSATSGLTLQLPTTNAFSPRLSLDANYSSTTDASRETDHTRSFGGMLRLEIPVP